MIHDDFTGAASNLSGRTPDTASNGNTWTVHSGAWAVDGSGSATGSGGSVPYNLAVIDTGASDGVVRADVAYPSGSASSIGGGLWVRGSNSANGWYVRCTRTGQNLQIVERNAGTETVRADVAIAFTTAHTLRITATLSGNLISAHALNLDTLAEASTSHSSSFNAGVTTHGMQSRGGTFAVHREFRFTGATITNSSSRQVVCHVRTTAAAARQVSCDVRARVVSSRPVSCHVQAVAASSRAVVCDVRSQGGSSRQVRCDVRSVGSASQAVVCHIRQLGTSQRQVICDVESESPVETRSSSRQGLCHVRSLGTSSRAVLCDVRFLGGSSRQLICDVESESPPNLPRPVVFRMYPPRLGNPRVSARPAPSRVAVRPLQSTT